MENNELDFVNIPVSEDYSEDNIKHLEWNEHIRTRPGMYIGKAGDGSAHDDGIYILLKEIIDNCIDEYVMGFGKSVASVVQACHFLALHVYAVQVVAYW